MSREQLLELAAGMREAAEPAYRFQQFYIPARMMPGILRYVREGIPPGDFLCAVIDNDLTEAVGRADDENMANLPAFVSYFYNDTPSLCWGSREKRMAWTAKFKPQEAT